MAYFIAFCGLSSGVFFSFLMPIVFYRIQNELPKYRHRGKNIKKIKRIIGLWALVTLYSLVTGLLLLAGYSIFIAPTPPPWAPSLFFGYGWDSTLKKWLNAAKLE